MAVWEDTDRYSLLDGCSASYETNSRRKRGPPGISIECLSAGAMEQQNAGNRAAENVLAKRG